jgi:hypothetical protein
MFGRVLPWGSRTGVFVPTAARHRLAAQACLVGTARAPSYNTRRHYLTRSGHKTSTTNPQAPVLDLAPSTPRLRLLIHHAHDPATFYQTQRCHGADHHGAPIHLSEPWRVQCVGYRATSTSASRHNLLQVLHDVGAARGIHLDRKARALYAH